MTPVAVLTEEQLEQLVARAMEPIRAELAQLRGQQGGELLTLPDAAVRLKRSLRTVERWAKAGQLQVVPIGGSRYVRLPTGPAPE